MDELVQTVANPWVLGYLGLLVAGQWAVTARRRAEEQQRAERRKAVGLTDETLADPAARLESFRTWSLLRVKVLLALGLGVPVVVLGLASAGVLADGASTEGLLLAFLTVGAFALWGSTDVAKSWLGGVAFQALVAARRPFQVGDRVVLGDHRGTVISIDAWYVRIRTLDDDLVSIPTASLWGQPLVSANAGSRASLVVIELFLSPGIDKTKRRQAEDFLWDAMQASAYVDPSRPVQLFVEQTGSAIVLRGKAYVGSTELEPTMHADVTAAFLDFAADHEIPLAK